MTTRGWKTGDYSSTLKGAELREYYDNLIAFWKSIYDNNKNVRDIAQRNLVLFRKSRETRRVLQRL